MITVACNQANSWSMNVTTFAQSSTYFSLIGLNYTVAELDVTIRCLTLILYLLLHSTNTLL